MQEFNDGSFGEIKNIEYFKKLLEPENSDELSKTKAIHFGTVEELEHKKSQGAFGKNNGFQEKDGTSVKNYLRRVDDKLNMIIKHFNIVHII